MLLRGKLSDPPAQADTARHLQNSWSNLNWLKQIKMSFSFTFNLFSLLISFWITGEPIGPVSLAAVTTFFFPAWVKCQITLAQGGEEDGFIWGGQFGSRLLPSSPADREQESVPLAPSGEAQVTECAKPCVEQSLCPGFNPFHWLHTFKSQSSNLTVQGEGPVIPCISLGDYMEVGMPGWRIRFSFAFLNNTWIN